MDKKCKYLYLMLRRADLFPTKVEDGDNIELVLAPNQYDANAIEVRKGLHTVGYLPRKYAEVLASLVHDNEITLEGGIVLEEEFADKKPRVRIEIGWKRDFPLSDDCDSRAYALFQEMLEDVSTSMLDDDPDAIEAFCEYIRPLVNREGFPRTGTLAFWLIRNLANELRHEEYLKRKRQEEAALYEAENLAAIAKVYSAFAFAEGGDFLTFGNLAVLPLRATRGVPVKTLPEAVMEGIAGFKFTQNVYQGSIEVVTSSTTPILAAAGTELKLNIGTCFIDEDRYIDGNKWIHDSYQSGHLKTTDSLAQPTFLRGAEMEKPDFPSLPKDSTGYAVFWGDTLRCIRLFGTFSAATQSLPLLLRYEWQIKNIHAHPAKQDAMAKVSGILEGLALFGDVHEGEVYFGHQKGIEGGTAKIDSSGGLEHVSVFLNGEEFDAARGMKGKDSLESESPQQVSIKAGYAHSLQEDRR